MTMKPVSMTAKSARFRRNITFAILIIVTQPTLASNTTIYRWVDEAGKIHFGDEFVRSHTSKKFQGNELVKVKTVSTNPKWLAQRNSSINKRSKKRVKHSKIQSNKASRCQMITAKTNKLEKLLRTKLNAGKFDQTNHSLSLLKWEKIKYC